MRKARNENLTSIDAIMDAEFSKPGTTKGKEFRKRSIHYLPHKTNCMWYQKKNYAIWTARKDWSKKILYPELKKYYYT